MVLLLRGCLQQPSKLIVRVDVRTESALDVWRWLLERGIREHASSKEITEEAAQRLVFSFPEASGKALAAAKLPTVLGGDGFEGNVPHGMAEGVQDSSIHGKNRTK